MSASQTRTRPWHATHLRAFELAWSILLTAQTPQGLPADRVEIGVVLLDDQVFVRAYRGVRSAWYGAIQSLGRGRVWLQGQELEVSFSPPAVADDPALATRIDAAYREKYGALAAGIGQGAGRDATVRIDPAAEPSRRAR